MAARYLCDTTPGSTQTREILGPEPVERGKMPKWLLGALKVAVKAGRLPKPRLPMQSPASTLEEICRLIGGSWQDHLGKITWDGVEFLVSEPYARAFSLKSHQELDKFSTGIGGAYAISANSFHYPGSTLRIVIGQNQESLVAYQNSQWVRSMSETGQRSSPTRLLKAK